MLDGWVKFAAVGRVGALMSALKKKLDVFLEEKMSDPSTDITHSPVVAALVQLITTDGQ